MNFASVPGLLCDAELWVHQMRFLADSADCRVAAVGEDHTVEDMAATVLAWAPDRIAALAGLSATPSCAKRPVSRGQLADYELPTLIGCGRDDALAPVDLHEEMAAAISAARPAVIEECNHF